MKWVTTSGGPLLALSEEDLLSWNGFESHYALVADQEEPAGVVDFGTDGQSQEALFLGDEPMDSTFLEDHRIIVQWAYADSETQLLEAVLDALPSVEWGDPVATVHLRSEAVMIDASVPGASVDVENRLEVPVPAGTYEIVSADLEPNDRVSVRLYRLDRV